MECKQTKKCFAKRFIALVLVCCAVITGLKVNPKAAEAKDYCFAYNSGSEDDKFEVSYDKTKYNIYWVSRKKITCYSQYRSTWSALDKGSKLGTATLRIYYLEPKTKTGGSYYAITGCQVSMDPVTLEGNVRGMAQKVSIWINTINEDSRVCSPSVEALGIQITEGTTNSSAISFEAGVGYDSAKQSWQPVGQIKGSFTQGASSSYTYNKTNVDLTQLNKDGAYARWDYDYISKNKDKTWNSYLFSSSRFACHVAYRLDEKPTYKNRDENIPAKLKYDIRFGAGNTSNGKVANRGGWSTNRDMCIKTGTMSLSY